MNTPCPRYCVYGIVIASDFPLDLPQYADGGLGEVECLSAPESLFVGTTAGGTLDPGSDAWHRYISLPDGATYVRWACVGEFLVAADGRSMACRRFEGSSAESFQVYMLGQALSFAW